MNKRKTIYFILVGISTLGILLLPFIILGKMVSLKFEPDDIGACISGFSGENLCNTIRNLEIAFAVCVIALIALIYFRKKIFKTKMN